MLRAFLAWLARGLGVRVYLRPPQGTWQLLWGGPSEVPRDLPDEWAVGVRDMLDTLADPYRCEDEANLRAEQLLREQLGEDYQKLVTQGYIDVPSRVFRNTFYRLRLRRPIEVFKNGRRQPWRLCVVSIERVPAADELLMKLLWLKTNEEYVLATANRVR